MFVSMFDCLDVLFVVGVWSDIVCSRSGSVAGAHNLLR